MFEAGLRFHKPIRIMKLLLRPTEPTDNRPRIAPQLILIPIEPSRATLPFLPLLISATVIRFLLHLPNQFVDIFFHYPIFVVVLAFGLLFL